ncbi:MAG: hypothetical protein JSV65_18530 [Armatimonadota bacterium]|nr:MAG: hypothetical protein JSV65_18530 [Armatimonadota bacterium]
MSETSRVPADAALRLTAAVNRFRRRVRILRAERSASLGLAAGLGLGVVLRIAELLHLFQPAMWWYAVAAGVPAIGMWVWAFLHPPSPLVVAAAADARLGIKDRAASALALGASPEPMTAALVEDAAEHVTAAVPRAVFRRRIAGRLWPPAAAAAALALAIFLPQWPALQSAEARAERAELKAKAEEFERLAEEIEQLAEPETEDIAEQVAANMRRLARDLRKPAMTQKRALSEMKDAAKQVAAARAKIEEQSSKKLAQAGAELSDVASAAAMARESERLRDLRELAQLKESGLRDVETLEDLADLNAEGLERLANLEPGKFDELKRLADLDPQSFEKLTNLSAEDLHKLTGLSQEQLRRLAELARRANARSLYLNLDMPQDLLDALNELFAKEDYLAALELMQALMEKLQERLKAQQSGEPGEPPELTEEELKRLQEELEKLAEMLKNTDLDELAKKLREIAEALSKMDIEELLKRLQECEGCCGGIGVGLGLLPGLGNCFGACAGFGIGAGTGYGVGPDRGGHRYVPGVTDRPMGPAQRTPAQFGDVNIRGRFGDEGDVMATEVYAPPSADGEGGKVPVYRVLPSYREQAEDALRQEEVPPEHRARVKKYFDSLTSE